MELMFQRDMAFEVGDYLLAVRDRYGPDAGQRGEGLARVERVQHIVRPAFLDRATADLPTRMAFDEMAAVWCQGFPGPILLRKGDHRRGVHLDADRCAWDREHPTWTQEPDGFSGGRSPEEPHPHRTRRTPADDGESPAEEPQIPLVSRRAASFTKPAHGLMVGDYLQVHARRHPVTSMGVDEGFHRVEWIGHLPAAHAAQLLHRPAAGPHPVVVASVHGVPGALVLADTDVQVLIRPNPERIALDQREPRHDTPFFDIRDVREPDVHSLRELDAQLRPPPPAGETDLYPSQFADDGQRELHLHGVSGMRMVPLPELPWPHDLFKCPHRERAKELARTYNDGERGTQVAHAELFTELTEPDFSACAYHQADWPAIVAVAQHHAELEAESPQDDAALAKVYAAEHLSVDDRQWAQDLIHDHLWWDQGAKSLTNGQHRLCAMRAANLPYVPVYGLHIPSHPEPEAASTPEPEAASTTIRHHATQTVQNYWTVRLYTWGAPPWAAFMGGLLARHRLLRRLLPPPDDDGQRSRG